MQHPRLVALPRWLVSAWHRVYARTARLPHIAVVLAVAGYVVSDTPSPLPRPWYFQDLIVGLSALISFVIAVVLNLLWRGFTRWAQLRVSVLPGARRLLTRMFVVVIVIAALSSPLVNLTWHRYATAYVGQPGPTLFYPLLSGLTGSSYWPPSSASSTSWSTRRTGSPGASSVG